MKKIYLKTLLTFVLSLLFGVQGWAQNAEIGKNISLSYTSGTFNIDCSNFNSSAQSVKIFIDFGEETVNYATCAYDRWTPQNTAKSFFNLNNFTKRYYTIIVTNSDIISEMASGAGVSVDYGPVRTVNVIVTNYSTADGAANDKSEASGIDPNTDENDPVVTMTLDEMIAEEMQLTNVPTIYLTVPDALNADGTRKDINSVIFKDRQKNEALYHQATIRVVDEKGGIEPFTDQVLIKARGNSTANVENGKLPYRLKFAKAITDEAGNVIANCQKHDMLGSGYSARNWTLLANKVDPALMRNALTYHIGKAVGMPFCPGYRFVDLVINGEYRGTYQVSDHVEVGENRVKVNEDTGWFLESSQYGMTEEPRVSAGGLFMSIKNPDYDANTEADKIAALKTEITNWWVEAEKLFCIWKGTFSDEAFRDPITGWRKYFDEESLVNFYIGINLTGDYDGFMTVKMYREANGKMKVGPLWDKDLAFGNWSSDDGTKMCEDQQARSNLFSDYMQRFMTDPVFVKKVHDKLEALIAGGLKGDLLTKITEIKGQLAKTQALNQTKWGSPASWVLSFNTFDEAVQQLYNYFDARVTFLQGAINTMYTSMGGDDIVIPEIPDTPTDPDDDNTPTGDLGALVDLGNGKYSYTGSASTFKEGTEITITTSTEETTLSNYITEGNTWNTIKSITLTATDVTALAANGYTFYMNATNGEVKAVNVKVPSEAGTGLSSGTNTGYSMAYTYVGDKNSMAEGATFNITLEGKNPYYKAFISDENSPLWVEWGYGAGPRNYTYTINADQAKALADNKYKINISVYEGTCSSASFVGASSGGSDTPTTPTYALTLSASEGGTVSGAGEYAEGTTVLIKAIPNEGYKFVKWSDDNTYTSRSVTLKEAITLTATFAAEGSADEDPFNEQGTRKQLTDLPTIYIDTNAAVGDSWGTATLDIYDSADKLYSTSWKSKSVYVQYQGSGAGGKDSYRLKFDKKTQMMDSGSFKQWVLLANDDDPTMLNNALAKVIGDAVDMPYTPGCQFVDLYVNNTYMGTYQLTDRVKAEPDRSLVADGNNNDDWQVRFNDNGELAEDNPATTDYIAGTTTMPNIIIKNPDPDDYHTAGNETGLAALKSTMSDYFTTVFATDENGNYTNIADMVNTDQLVAWYIAQEILGVYKGFSSIEAYRSVTSLTDQKLHIGPLWDSEKGFGNTGEVTAPDNTTDLDNDASHNGLMISWSAYPMMKNLFTNLWTQPWFKTAVKTKWEEISGTLPASLSQTIETLSGTIAESQALNAQKWNNSLGEFDSYEDALAATNAYITARFAYLDKKFAVLAEGACEHTYANSLYADNGDGTHSPKCDNCDYINAEVKTAHGYTAKENHPYCDICKATETATITGTVADDTKVYRIHEAVKTTDIKYVTAESTFAPSGNKIYICNEEITGETNNLKNVVWPRSADTDYNGNEIVLSDGDYTYDENEKMHVKSASYTRSMSSTWGTLCLPFKVASCEDYTLYEIKDTKIGDDNKSGTIVFSEITEASGLQPVVFRKKTSAGSVTFRGVAQTEGVNNGLVTVKKSKKLGNTDAMVSTGVEGSGTWALYGNAKKNKTTAEISPNYSNVYYIASNKFWQGDADVTVATFRAVFVFTPAPGNEATAKSFTISFDDNFTTDINSTVIDKNLAIFTGNGEIILNANYDTRVSIYSTNGTAVTTTNIEKGVHKNISLPNGMYIINGTKVVVK